jgi:3-(3-hydroxy-phenyl)propionate hydroxylase
MEVAQQDWPLRGGTLHDDGTGGTLAVQSRVGTPSQAVLFDDVITPPGFVLLGRDRDPVALLTPTQRAAWQQLGGRGAHFGPGGLTDTDGTYAAWFDRLDAAVVAVRPDFQVFGSVRDPRDAGSLVHGLAKRILA